MNITQFTIEEVRCFAGRQHFNIRPLTFLVGENSTGKTTALACFSILSRFLKDGEVDFNSPPYSLGIFRDIVRKSKVKEKSFGLGLTIEGEKENIEFDVRFKEEADSVEPAIDSATVRFGDDEVVFEAATGMEFGIQYGSYNEERKQHRVSISPGLLERSSLFSSLSILSVPIGKNVSAGEKLLAELLRQNSHMKALWPPWSIANSISVYDSAPVRSKPDRTYDFTKEYDDPEGSHVPLRLMRLKEIREKDWAL